MQTSDEEPLKEEGCASSSFPSSFPELRSSAVSPADESEADIMRKMEAEQMREARERHAQHDDSGGNNAEEGATEIDNEEQGNYSDDYGDLREFKKPLGERLSTAFKGKATHSTFSTSGSLPDAPNPGLTIEGLGSIGLPLSEHDAERLIAVSEPAPFGKQDKTIVDPAVQRTWQIDTTRVRCRNSAWDSYLQDRMACLVGEAFGIARRRIRTNLYKLLLYGKDGHLEKHRDTEKEPRMFATLVIILPSLFSGGKVSMYHNSKEVLFDTADNSEFGTSYAFWYTDVFHKIHPVTTGYRLALSYNVTLTSVPESLPRAPIADAQMLAIRDMLKAWLARADAGWDVPDFVGHLLNHKYSQVGLDFENIKGDDRVKVAFLKDTAAELGFCIYLALFLVEVHGLGSSRTMEEEVYRKITVGNAVGADGHLLQLRRLAPKEDDMVPTFDPKYLRCDKRDFDEETCVIHHYHRTIVLLWPMENRAFMELRGRADETVLTTLMHKIEIYKNSKPSSTSPLREEIRLLARGLPINRVYSSMIAHAAVMLGDKHRLVKAAIAYFPSIDAFLWTEAAHTFTYEVVCHILDQVLDHLNEDPPEREDAAEDDYDVKSATPALCVALSSLREAALGDTTILTRLARHTSRFLDCLSSLSEELLPFIVEQCSGLAFDQLHESIAGLLVKSRQTQEPISYRSGSPVFDPTPQLVAFTLVDELRKLYGTSEQALYWVDEQELLLLKRSSLQTESITQRLLVLSVRLGVDRCKDVLEHVLKAYEAALHPPPSPKPRRKTVPIEPIHFQSPATVGLLDELRKAWHEDEAGQLWIDEFITSNFRKAAIVNYQRVEQAMQILSRVRFPQACSMFEVMGKTIDNTDHWSRHPTSLKCGMSVIATVLDRLGSQDTWADWCIDALVVSISAHKSLSDKECEALGTVVSYLIRMKAATNPTLLPRLLTGFRRETCDAVYFQKVILPFLHAVKKELDRYKLTFRSPPFREFTSELAVAADLLRRAPEPERPGDLSLPAIQGEVGEMHGINEFLQSSSQHALKIQADQATHEQVCDALRFYVDEEKLQLSSLVSEPPRTLVVIKRTPKTPPPHVPSSVRRSLSYIERCPWLSAIRQHDDPGCSECSKMKRYMEWVDAGPLWTSLDDALGKGVMQGILDGRERPGPGPGPGPGQKRRAEGENLERSENGKKARLSI